MLTSQKPMRGLQIDKTHPLARGLVGCWVFNEKTGDTVFDLSGHGNHGDIIGADWVPEGLDFVRANSDYIDIGSPTELIINGEMSVSGMFRANSEYENTQVLVACSIASTGNTAYAVTFGFTNNKLELWNSASGPNITSTKSISDNNLYHYVITRTGSTSNWDFKIYIDGVLDNSDSATRNPTGVPTSSVSIGRYGAYNGFYANVLMPNTMIWDRCLSPSEVAQLNREPYAMFQQPISPALLYYEASGAIDVYLTLSQSMAVTDLGQAIAQAPVVLSNTLTAIDTAQAVAGGAVALSSSLAAVDGGNADSQGSMVVPYSLSFTAGADAVAESTITIAEILATLQAATIPSAGFIDSPNKRRSVMGIPAIPNNQIYGRDKQQIAGLYRGSFEYVPGALSLQEIIAVSSSGQAAVNRNVTLSKVLTILQTGLVSAEGGAVFENILSAVESATANTSASVSLSDVLTTTISGRAAAEAIVAFSESLAVAQTTAEITQAYLTLAYNLAVQSGAVSTAASTLALAINAGISASVTINVDESLTLSESFVLSQTGQANAQGPVVLSNTLALSILAEAVAAAGLSLDAVISISTNYETITVVTPDGRTVVIAVEFRQTLISEEDRTVIIT